MQNVKDPLDCGDPAEDIRVLFVIGDRAVAKTIDFTLRHGPYARRSEWSVKDARAAITDWKPQLLVVDVDLEEGAALQLIEEAAAGGPTGVIALTKRSDLRGKIAAFDRGADDYISIPFVPDDLIIRVRALARRALGTAPAIVPQLRIGDLHLDAVNRTVRAGEIDLQLTALEQSLLYLLAANAGTIFTRDQILDSIWGADFVSESNIVDRHIRALRAKLRDDWHKPRYIETVPGTGYRFLSTTDTEPEPPLVEPLGART